MACHHAAGKCMRAAPLDVSPGEAAAQQATLDGQDSPQNAHVDALRRPLQRGVLAQCQEFIPAATEQAGARSTPRFEAAEVQAPQHPAPGSAHAGMARNTDRHVPHTDLWRGQRARPAILLGFRHADCWRPQCRAYCTPSQDGARCSRRGRGSRGNQADLCVWAMLASSAGAQEKHDAMAAGTCPQHACMLETRCDQVLRQKLFAIVAIGVALS